MTQCLYLLDTSVYSQRLRPRPVVGVIRRWGEYGDARLAIASICEAELIFGLEKKNSARLWTEYRAYLRDRLVSLPVDQGVAAVYGRLRAQLEASGSVQSDFDLLIAATALHHGLKLATLNPRHFQCIPDLIVEDWSL